MIDLHKRYQDIAIWKFKNSSAQIFWCSIKAFPGLFYLFGFFFKGCFTFFTSLHLHTFFYIALHLPTTLNRGFGCSWLQSK